MSTGWAPETAPPPEPLPPGVLGYMVACKTPGTYTTHTTVMDRETAEAEAAQWGRRYKVYELREVTVRSGTAAAKKGRAS